MASESGGVKKFRRAKKKLGPSEKSKIVHIERTNYVTIDARYENTWETPMAGAPVAIYVNGNKVKEARLKDYEDVGLERDTAPEPGDEAKIKALGTYTFPEDESETLPPGQVEVELIRESGHEQAIEAFVRDLAPKMAKTYSDLVESMSEYQSLYKNWGYTGVYLAYTEGFAEEAWSSVKQLGEAEYWKSWGDSISGAFVWTLDAAESAYEEVSEKVSDAYEHRGDVLQAAWWADKAAQVEKAASDTAASLAETAQEASEDLGRAAEQLEAAWRARTAIMALPGHILEGNTAKIEHFVDNVLPKIHPELATQIRNSDWQGTLEIIHDGRAIALVVTFLQLYISAIPPTFYAHQFGRAGFHVAIEVVLIIIGALLGGVGAAVRIGTLVAKLGSLAVKVGSASKKLKKMQSARTAFFAMLRRMEDIAKAFDKLRRRLKLSRRHKRSRVKPKQRHHRERRKTKEREGRCRICGKTSHRTPRMLKGSVVYE